MDKKPLPELDRICAAFAVEGRWVSSCPIPSGHINDTYCSEFETAGRRVKYVNQRINHLVFREPEKLMENIERVTRYARERILAVVRAESADTALRAARVETPRTECRRG